MGQQQAIKHYVLENFLFSDDASALDNHASLIRTGVLDSTGVHELVLFIEEQFGVVVAPEEMVPDNFDSIEAVDRFVSRKRAD